MMTDVLRDGRYRVEHTLGTGAMGTVVLAHDTVLARRVAVKVLADHLAADDAFRQRFLREARLAARLCHPNIVQVFDAGDDGRPFLVMEYVDGDTVADRLARGPAFRREEVVALATGLSAALAQAHSMGIVHRDVKPHNVLLGPGGVAKLTDFGIARALEEGGMTEIGTVLGTAPFMAPEQAAGLPVGPPADVFALGAVIRHAAGGALPPALEALVAAALDPEPAARPSAEELHAGLVALDDGGLTEPDEAAPTVVVTPAPTRILAAPAAPVEVEAEPYRKPKPLALILAVASVVILLLAILAGGNHGEKVSPVPTGPDAAQTARNLATWLRDQGGS
jgi:serine/threonine protein kinase